MPPVSALILLIAPFGIVLVVFLFMQIIKWAEKEDAEQGSPDRKRDR